MPVQTAEIAAMFDQTGDLLEIKGENQFRVPAYAFCGRLGAARLADRGDEINTRSLADLRKLLQR